MQRHSTFQPAAGIWRRAAASAAAMFLLAPAAQAMSFTQAYEAALANDASYRAAGHELEAAQQGVPIARASLLPLVTLSASDSIVRGSRTFPNGQNQEVRTRLDYTSPQATLGLRTPLFNYEAISAYRQAKAQALAAEDIYRSHGAELIDRLAAAFLQVLLATENRSLAQTQTSTIETQLAQIQQRQQRGEGTRVQVAQYQAALDVSRARVVETSNLMELAHRELTRITGLPRGEAPQFVPDQSMPALFPRGLTEWIDAAVRQSPLLKAREHTVDVARFNVQRQSAGHLPRLDLVGGISRNENDSTNNIGQTASFRSIGVQLTVPLFSGGGVQASVRQAAARLSQAEEELRSERELLEVDVQRYFQAIAFGEKRISAYQQAVTSTALAWEGARRSLELGLGTVSDVADAQGQHFSARRDLVQARIEQLLSRMRLMLRAAMPTPDVVSDLENALTPSAGAQQPEQKP